MSHMDCTDLTKTQRALTLWVAGTIMLQMVLDAKSTRHTKSVKGSHNLTLPKLFHTEESTSFSDWLRATRKYMDFIMTGLCESFFDKIIGKAKEMKFNLLTSQVNQIVIYTIILYCTEIYEQSALWSMAHTCIALTCNSFFNFTVFAICYSPTFFINPPAPLWIQLLCILSDSSSTFTRT